MCHQNSCPLINVEEAVSAEESLLVFCKPVELYNILQRRAEYNPPFLSRCLDYKIEAKWETRLIDQNVIFNYRDQNNLLRKTEVTRNFTCPFCLLSCGSFKGLRCHLRMSHDLFKCEFWTSEEYRAVNVSVRTDTLCSESSAAEIEPQLESFSFCSRPRKRKRPEDPLEKGKHVYPQVLELPALGTEILHNGPLEKNEGERAHCSYPRPGELHISSVRGETCRVLENGLSYAMDGAAANSNQGLPVARAQSVEDIDCLQSMSVTAAVLPHAKSRKLSSERTESRSSTLLQKRQFYHSHRAQPMGLEQVMSERDSEDEVDDDISGLEDRRGKGVVILYGDKWLSPLSPPDKLCARCVDVMLDDFVDVTRDEKHLMRLWNSFVRKQRVLADGHVPWACEAFLQLHGKLLVQSPALFWCWRLFMVKLWNHGLLDANTMNNCSVILQKCQDETLPDGTCSNTCKPEP